MSDPRGQTHLYQGPRGAVAQLVAHLHGMEGVRGSNPLSSTKVSPVRSLSCDTLQEVRTALATMAVTHSTPTLQKAHNCLTRALRHAEGRDLVRRNVSALVDIPRGREGRPSQA